MRSTPGVKFLNDFQRIFPQISSKSLIFVKNTVNAQKYIVKYDRSQEAFYTPCSRQTGEFYGKLNTFEIKLSIFRIETIAQFEPPY